MNCNCLRLKADEQLLPWSTYVNIESVQKKKNQFPFYPILTCKIHITKHIFYEHVTEDPMYATKIFNSEGPIKLSNSPYLIIYSGTNILKIDATRFANKITGKGKMLIMIM